jgi:hypothetical protein
VQPYSPRWAGVRVMGKRPAYWLLVVLLAAAASIQTLRLSAVQDRAEAWAQAFNKCAGR